MPAAFVLLESLPTTPNGKIDRKRLPTPNATPAERTKGYTAPRNETEKEIAALWAGLLGVATVGIQDNFFELGGHSLLATQLVSRLGALCCMAVPLGVVFEYPTIAAFFGLVSGRPRRLANGISVRGRPRRGLAMTERNAAEFLAFLRERDIRIWLEDENLRFNAPKDALTPELRAELVAKKPDIIRFLQQAQSLAATIPQAETPPILPASRDESLPLSFAQQRLWFLEQFDPGRAAYNICPCFDLRGSVNADILQAALNRIVTRHEALRTVFPAADGLPAQKILPSVTIPFETISLAHLPEGERETEANRLLDLHTAPPFDLQNGPLIRALLIEIAPQEYRFLLGLHHIVCDGWAMSRLISELNAIYNAALRGQWDAACAAENPVPRFCGHGSGNVSRAERWKIPCVACLLENQDSLIYRPTLNLPIDFPRPPRPTYRGGMVKFHLCAPLTESLKTLSRRENATLFMTLLAAFQTLLFRYTNQEDFNVGTPIANRQAAELEPLIGFFVNTLVLRGDLSGQPTFRELLQRTRTTALEAYANQDAPFEQVVDAVQPERSLQMSPLFQVLFALQNTPQERLLLDRTHPAYLEYRGGVSKFDLSLFLEERDHALFCDLEYSADLFLPATIERFAAHFQTLLQSAAESPNAPIDQLPLLPETERNLLLNEWNQTDSDYPRHLCVHQLFERQVQLSPDTIALTFGTEKLTYRALNERANRVARFLRKQNVGPETRVGMCLPRSPDMVTALLAVLKAGGAYVPLDPAYPAERLVFMLEDAAAPVLLTTTALRETLPKTAAQVVCVDAIESELAQEAPENLGCLADAENLAYVLYTSGSTGKPKGVAMPHRPLVNLISWQVQQDALSVGSSTLQFTPIHFDVSFQEIFATLCSGGTLKLITRELQRDALALLRFIAAEKIERIFLPYVALQNLAQAVELGGALPAHLREIVTAGEALQITPQIRGLMRSLPACRLHNHYGPTETHVVTAHTLNGSPDAWPVLPPIGKLISNVSVYILDQNLNPVPLGVSGGLYLAGDCLANGYLNNPVLTTERFLAPLPALISDRHPRLYSTGDLARWLPNGELQFLGRADEQVKIRGHRVEPGEIETALLANPDVREAAVIALETGGEKRLAAYVTGEDSEALSPAELRRYLQNLLPEYMIPSAFVRLDELPKTASGKISRRSLRAPENFPSESSAPFVPPQSEIEQKIAEVWRHVLQVETVGIHDNFFDIGGHSLRIAQVQARLQQILAREVAVVALFQYPTIRALAESLRQDSAPSSKTAPAANAIQERARRQREALASRRAPR